MLTCFAGCSQICAVLAAVTEVIRSRGGKESETEYFAALVSAGCVEEALRRDRERCFACSLSVFVQQRCCWGAPGFFSPSQGLGGAGLV